MILQTGSALKDQTIGGNVIEKITPETYIKMNEEFEREGTPIHIIVPTQEQIDNPTGVKLPETFTPQPPMTVDGSDPWPHSNNRKNNE